MDDEHADRGSAPAVRTIRVIGIGAGNPNHLTVQAIAALNATDVFFIPHKGAEKEDLKRLRLQICERFIVGRNYRIVDVDVPVRDRSLPYREGVASWHAAIAVRYETLIRQHLAGGQSGAFLVWGDPALYDSTLRIIEAIQDRGLALDVEVIPGISSVQALAARHRVSLNRIGGPVAIVPGRRLAEALAAGMDSLVVVLDGEGAYRGIVDADVDIFWGAYVGTPDERLVAGPLTQVKDEIDATRERCRREKGWIMDSYLLRRRGGT